MHSSRVLPQLFFFAIALLALCALTPVRAALAGPQDEDRAAFANWGTRYEYRVLNPPSGKQAPEITRAVEYLKSIATGLADSEVLKNMTDLKVTLTVSPGMRLEVRAIPVAKMVKEWRAKTKSTRPHPVLKALEISEDLEYFCCELAVDAGVLRQFNEAEIAWWIAHELGHVREGHPPMKVNAKVALDMQQLEAVADEKGLVLYVGKYNLESILTANEKLFVPKSNHLHSRVHAAEAALTSHPFEGLRISFLQGRIDQLQKSRADAQPLPVREVPDDVKLWGIPLQRRGAFHHPLGFPEAIQPKFLRIVQTHFIEQEPFPWATPSSGRSDALRDFDETFKLGAYPTPKELGTSIEKALEMILRSPLDIQGKLDASLRFVVYSKSIYSTPFEELPEHVLNKIGYQLLSLGKESLGASPVKSWPRLRQMFPRVVDPMIHTFAFTKSKALQSQIAKLGKIDPVWLRFFTELPMESLHLGSFHTLNLIRSVLGHGSQPVQDGPLAALHKQSVLDMLTGPSFKSMFEQLRDDEQVSFLVTLRKELKEHSQDPFAKSVASAISDPLKSFSAKRMNALTKSTGLSDLSRMIETHSAVPFTARERSDVESALLRISRQSAESGRAPSIEILSRSPSLQWFVSRILDNDSIPRADRIAALKFLAASLPFSTDLADSSLKQETLDGISRFINQLSKEEFLQIFEKGSPETERQAASLFDEDRIIRKKKEMLALWNKLPKSNTPERDRQAVNAFIREQLKLIDLQYSATSSRLSLLTLAGANREEMGVLVSKFQFPDLVRISQEIFGLRDLWQRRVMNPSTGLFVGTSTHPFTISSSSALFLFDVLAKTQEQAPSLEAWYRQLERIMRYRSTSLEMRPELRETFERYLAKHLEKMQPKEIYTWLKKENILKILTPETSSRLLTDYAMSVLPRNSSVGTKRIQIERIEKQLRLVGQHPEIYSLFREELSDRTQVQPADLERLFPPNSATIGTETVRGYGPEMRGFAGLLGVTRREPVDDQIHMMEYLMGRRLDMPHFALETTEMIESVIPVRDFLRQFRSRLQRENVVNRLIVVNSFLAGPSSLMNDPAGKERILALLLGPVNKKNETFAREVANALLESLGHSQSLGISYVLAQKPKAAGAALTEGEILRSLFEAYGTAGVKLGQYLGFTSELAHYSEALAPLQDAALPLSRTQAIALIRKRFDGEWPPEFKVTRVLGTGSVNAAIEFEYEHLTENGMKKSGVISLAREEIEISTREDFRRLGLFVDSLTKTKEGERKFGFLKGLLKIIERSVTLEFNKTNALAIQKAVKPLYDRKFDGWKIKVLEAHEARNMGLFMDKGEGITARKLIDSNSKHFSPKLYHKAMRMVSQVEVNALLGVDQSGKPNPVPLFANPDFHDGQILVDEATRTITILDFGQALPISNREREWGIDLLRVINNLHSSENSADLINRIYRESAGQARDLIAASDLDPLLKSTDPMDVFVKVLSKLEERGFEVPLSTIHWVLGVNRQAKLGEKIGVPVRAEFRNLLLSRKAGLSLENYNFAHLLKERLKYQLSRPFKAACVQLGLKLSD
jgi:hypothetical protein